MSLNIKNEETYRLVRELADLTGESMTGAVTEAVRERLKRIKSDCRAAVGTSWTLAREIRERLPAGTTSTSSTEAVLGQTTKACPSDHRLRLC